MISHSILNKFAPRHSIFLQELRKKKEESDRLELEMLQKKNERKLLRKQKRLSKKVEYRSKSTIRDYFGYISSEKPCYKRRIEEVESYEEEENPQKFVARNT